VTSFAFTTQDLRSAPIEVRRWLIGRIESELVALASVVPVAVAPAESPALAACTPEEAFGIFDRIKGDFAATHVFLELGRDQLESGTAAPLHAVNIDALLRNTQLDDHRLVSCLRTINRAFQDVRRDPEAMLFGFDQADHVYVHEATYHSVHNLWQQLLQLHAPAETRTAEPVDWPAAGFEPRQLGPSESIAGHRQH